MKRLLKNELIDWLENHEEWLNQIASIIKWNGQGAIEVNKPALFYDLVGVGGDLQVEGNLKGTDDELSVSGNLNASGKITASEIVEDMEGYSITDLTTKDLLDDNNNVMGAITPEVVKVSKNGNVLHLIWILKFTATQTFSNVSYSHSLGNIFGITIPSEIADKITTTSSNVVALNYVDRGYTVSAAFVLGSLAMTHKLIKNGNTLYLNLTEHGFAVTSSFISSQGVYQRIECSILLNDNLVG